MKRARSEPLKGLTGLLRAAGDDYERDQIHVIKRSSDSMANGSLDETGSPRTVLETHMNSSDDEAKHHPIRDPMAATAKRAKDGRRSKEGHRRPNGKWEARYRPKSKVKLDDSVCHELSWAYRGFDAAKQLHKYEWLAYFDSKREKDEYLNEKRGVFKRACDRQPGSRGNMYKVCAPNAHMVLGTDTPSPTPGRNMSAFDLAWNQSSRGAAKGCHAGKANVISGTSDDESRDNEQKRAMSPSHVEPVVFKAMCNAFFSADAIQRQQWATAAAVVVASTARGQQKHHYHHYQQQQQPFREKRSSVDPPLGSPEEVAIHSGTSDGGPTTTVTPPTEAVKTPASGADPNLPCSASHSNPTTGLTEKIESGAARDPDTSSIAEFLISLKN